jgi:5'-nucleotidase (lipoprotein e(P4) family)
VDAEHDFGVRWVRHAAEYEAVSQQAFAAATEDLPRLAADTSWSALPGHGGLSARLEPAIIFDIDETVVNNVEFQATYEPPFNETKFDAWHEANRSKEVPGAAAFVQRARAAGVKLFFVTNRSCVAASADPCPQKRIALDDLREAGIAADPQELMLSGEQPGWTQEKQVRRDAVGARHRVIMVFGDDLGDFLPCVRRRVYSPCTEPATGASRLEQTRRNGKYWGEGWYVLPNPMYGSWTSAQ